MFFNIIFFSMLMIPPVIILAGMKKRVSANTTIFTSIVAVSLVTIGILAIARSSGIALGEEFINGAKQIADVIAKSDELAGQAGLGELSYHERYKLILTMYSAINTLLPATIIVFTAIFTYLLYMFISKMFRKIGKNPEKLTPMKEFGWPPSLFIGYLMLSLLAMLFELMEPFATANLYMNISIIFEYMLAAQGLGAVFMMLDKKKIPKVVGAFVGAAGIVIGFVRMVLFAFGMFDFLFSMRGRMARK
ncbi:MAG: DUF2232 domain-containing protein [Firmicutes bacterium]|nr:DUF2232 domain-containing protein [Bacillota bacterium]MBQ9972795.1 DUF2232 domain-containing protein [Bacillota bacterium]